MKEYILESIKAYNPNEELLDEILKQMPDYLQKELKFKTKFELALTVISVMSTQLGYTVEQAVDMVFGEGVYKEIREQIYLKLKSKIENTLHTQENSV